MKPISDQLKDLGLKHGDLCEIEGVEGRCLVAYQDRDNIDLYAKAANGVVYSYSTNHKVTCGWKAVKPEFTEFCLYTAYTKVLPAPIPKPLPEAVEAVVEFCNESEQREFARAMLAEVEKMIEARLK